MSLGDDLNFAVLHLLIFKGINPLGFSLSLFLAHNNGTGVTIKLQEQG